MKRYLYLCITLLFTLCLVACGTKDNKVATQTAVTEEPVATEPPEQIKIFCEVMNVEAKELTVIQNFSDKYGNVCFDIGVDGNKELSGTYIISTSTEGDSSSKRIDIYRKVTEKEIEDNGLYWDDSYADLYLEVYRSDVEKTKEKLSPKAISVDISTVDKYEENTLDTSEIWELTAAM